MNFMSLVKRIAPFFLTFAVGLFIAGFFVTVAAPSFQFSRGGFNRHREDDRRMRCENQRLREENERLRNRLNEMEDSDWVLPDNGNIPQQPVAPIKPLYTVPNKSR